MARIDFRLAINTVLMWKSLFQSIYILVQLVLSLHNYIYNMCHPINQELSYTTDGMDTPDARPASGVTRHGRSPLGWQSWT